MIYNNLLTYDNNFQSEAHDMKTNLFLINFERVKLIQEPEFLVNFCIFLSGNNISTYDKKCESEAYGMKMGLFSIYFFGLCRL